MRIQTSWDDGHPLDLKVYHLLKKYSDIPAIFYIPLRNREREVMMPDWIRQISQDYEIGGHTLSHAVLTRIPRANVLPEILEGKERLEEVIGKPIQSFCYPRGYYNDFIREQVKEAGFKEARTTQVLYTDMPVDPYELHTTIHVYQRKEYQGRDWLELAKELFDTARAKNGYFHLWGHSWEIEKYNQWKKLDQFFQYMSERI